MTSPRAQARGPDPPASLLVSQPPPQGGFTARPQPRPQLGAKRGPSPTGVLARAPALAVPPSSLSWSWELHLLPAPSVHVL